MSTTTTDKQAVFAAESVSGPIAGPVAPRRPGRYRPLTGSGPSLGAGLLGDLQRRNTSRSIPEGAHHISSEGALENFEHAAAGESPVEHHGPVFEDGEVYKWLEAVAWTCGLEPADEELAALLSSTTELIASAQADDGYLNTFTQISGKRTERYQDLSFDHEVFNNGALIQAAVAQYRATGRRELLDVATKVADHLDATFGPAELGKRPMACGHPLTEMALVELFRTTGEQRYLDLAKFLVDVRGQGKLATPYAPHGAPYFSDRLPVREQTSPEGHAVRAVYLAAGATDVATETGDTELLDAVRRQWDSMVSSKMYVTGGLGSRWDGEAFGDPFELPADRAYAETCAAIGSIQWEWRMLLATGEAKYADVMERQLYNAVLPGLGMDGESYFYVNALQVRSGAVVDDPGERTPAHGRQKWFGCSCCPTNIMRTLGSIQYYLATGDETSVQLHHYTAATVDHELATGAVKLVVDTEYPWNGTVRVTVEQTPDAAWSLDLRVPSWADGASLTVAGEPVAVSPGGYVGIERSWHAGDEVVLTLPMVARLVQADPRVDDARGCVAIMRGPIVYAVEQVDVPDVAVDDLVIIGSVRDDGVAEELGGVPAVCFEAGVTERPDGESAGFGERPADTPVSVRPVGDIRAVPYFRWANRQVDAMRVWIPRG